MENQNDNGIVSDKKKMIGKMVKWLNKEIKLIMIMEKYVRNKVM